MRIVTRFPSTAFLVDLTSPARRTPFPSLSPTYCPPFPTRRLSFPLASPPIAFLVVTTSPSRPRKFPCPSPCFPLPSLSFSSPFPYPFPSPPFPFFLTTIPSPPLSSLPLCPSLLNSFFSTPPCCSHFPPHCLPALSPTPLVIPSVSPVPISLGLTHYLTHCFASAQCSLPIAHAYPPILLPVVLVSAASPPSSVFHSSPPSSRPSPLPPPLPLQSLSVSLPPLVPSRPP
ncbi:unnamed protein product [Closterium sp. Naga37s-1]|nr:unnamed protein product [Closterium sp. Naga37s-1]